MKHELEVRPLRLFLELETLRLSAVAWQVVAWRARCSCSWRSGLWNHRGQAAAAGRLHVL